MSDLAEEYAANVGRPHRNLPEDHPYRWQWDYRGSKADKERLKEFLEVDLEEDEEPVVIEGQEELF